MPTVKHSPPPSTPSTSKKRTGDDIESLENTDLKKVDKKPTPPQPTVVNNSNDSIERVQKTLNDIRMRFSFGNNSREGNSFGSPNLQSRPEEIPITRQNLVNDPHSIPEPNNDVEQVEAIVKRLMKPLQDELEKTKKEIVTLKSEMNHLKTDNNSLREKVNKNENYNRKSNLKLFGINEDRNENARSSKRKEVSLMNTILETQIPEKWIKKAHRISGRNFNKNQPRPILVEFLHPDERTALLERKELVKNRFGVIIEEDYTQDVEDKSRHLHPLMVAINNLGRNTRNPRYKAHLYEDHLIVNGQRYSVDTIYTLPDEISPEKLATPSNGILTAFFSRFSPLSNFYPANFKVDGTSYNCNEQHYFHKRALTFGDSNSAKKIMEATDPAVQHSLGRKINGFVKRVWEDKQVDVMRDGLRKKFQIPELKEFLLKTGDTTLVEASANDKYWGVRFFTMTNYKLWDGRNWSNTSTNMLGQLLMEIRRDLKYNQ